MLKSAGSDKRWGTKIHRSQALSVRKQGATYKELGALLGVHPSRARDIVRDQFERLSRRYPKIYADKDVWLRPAPVRPKADTPVVANTYTPPKPDWVLTAFLWVDPLREKGAYVTLGVQESHLTDDCIAHIEREVTSKLLGRLTPGSLPGRIEWVLTC